MLKLNEIFRLADTLEIKGTNHPILESAMLFAFGFDWEKVEIYKEFFEYAKDAMYFETAINTWVVK